MAPGEGPGLDIAAALALINERLDALEAAGRRDDDQLADDEKRQVEIEKMAWFVTHGRKRPW